MNVDFVCPLPKQAIKLIKEIEPPDFLTFKDQLTTFPKRWV